ncbi:hypothetical protein VAEU17_330058 [Vibrio aestuarianus]|nr:hypothetical protein VAEU17_330058 [Vibrio aestuarianus]
MPTRGGFISAILECLSVEVITETYKKGYSKLYPKYEHENCVYRY